MYPQSQMTLSFDISSPSESHGDDRRHVDIDLIKEIWFIPSKTLYFDVPPDQCTTSTVVRTRSTKREGIFAEVI